MNERPWTIYAQGAAVAAFSSFSLLVNVWFLWRAWVLHGLGDAWQPALLFGSVLGPIFLIFSAILWTLLLKVAASEKPLGARSLSLLAHEEALIEPVLGKPTAGFLATIALLGCFSLWAVFAWGWQLFHGLRVTGLNNPVFWGFYITNFVFFIGISHAGTLISAILRIANAEWRRSITRSAEVITVLVLVFGAGNIILDLGRPDRALNVFLFGRLQSPLLWDVCSITTYLVGSTLYLYLPLIPDIAILRDRCRDWRQPIYDLLSFGWSGTKEEMRILEKCIAVMAIMVIPVAISVHTVVSYVFSMTVQPMWHSTIFGPYFVVGAIFSGIAALIIAMAALRRVYHLEEYLRPIHFKNLGLLLLVMSCLWLYFTFSEFLTTWYGNDPEHIIIFYSKLTGPYAPFFWTMVATCFLIPFSVLASPLGSTVRGTVIASVPVCVGMWLERFLIVVPTLVRPRLPYSTGAYAPSWVEVSLFAGCIATFVMLYALFTRLFPIVSVWEVREGEEHAVSEVSQRIRTYFPGGENTHA